MADKSAARQIDSERDIDASRVEVTCSECGAHNVVPRKTVKAVIECRQCRTFLAADPTRAPLVVSDEDGAKSRTQEFWDANPCGSAATWEETRDVRFSITDPYLTRYLTEDRLRNRSVLEIGCGQGADADVMTRYCRRYVGVDLSEQSIEIARREVGKRQPTRARPVFLTADAEALPFHDKQFDMVYSVGVLHHTPDFLAAIREAHRVLEPDGALVLMLYRSFTPLWLILRTLRGTLGVPLIGPWVKNKIISLLRAARSGEGGSSTGTAFLELVGCPIIDTYTLRGLRRIFAGRFVIEDADCYRVGFDQIVRCTPSFLRSIWPQRWMKWCEERLRRWLGFYLVVTARKLGESTA